MANTNVNIKLSADTKQLRSELKMIDRELQELGGSSKINTNNSGTSKKPQDSASDNTQSSKNSSKDESSERLVSQLYKEASLIRKELQRMNRNNVGGQPVNGSPSSNGSTNSGGSSKPKGSNKSDTSTTEDTETGRKLSDVIGKLATAAVTLRAVSSAWGSLSSSAKYSASGESTAFYTYGSTLAYNDYNVARKDASNIGSPYGYDYEAVMNAGGIYSSRAGFTNLNNYNADVNSVLASSKAWGIDSNMMANTSGFMSSIGVYESGEQKKFADMLADSIVSANMVGREDEQLQVLETISENLSRTMVKVDGSAVNSVMGLYTSIANNNPTLRGMRGADIVNNIGNSIVNGSSTIDNLLGWGTEYTGVAGRVELERLKEQGLSNPETLSKIFQNFQRFTGKDIDSDYGRLFLNRELGLSYSQIDAVMKSKSEIMSGNYNLDLLDGEGSGYTQKVLDNYNASDVSAQERTEAERKEMSEDRGGIINDILKPFRRLYNVSPDWMKQSADLAGWGIQNIALPVAGLKGFQSIAGSKGVQAILESYKAGGFKGLLGDTKGLVSSGKSAVVGGLKNADNLPKVAKFGKAFGAIGTGIEVVDGVGDFLSATDNAGRGKAVGSTIGSIGGGWGGALAGAALGSAILPVGGTIIGGLIGGIGGGLGGDWLGGKLGSSIGGTYDEDVYEDNTSAIEQNTEALNRLSSKNTEESQSGSKYKDYGYNLGRSWGNLFTSHATGNPYVPYDNYLASLHKGEAVLTAQEADDYRRNGNGSSQSQHSGVVDININLSGSVSGMTSENQNKIVEVVLSRLSTSNLQNMISNGFQRVQNY